MEGVELLVKDFCGVAFRTYPKGACTVAELFLLGP